MRITFEQSPKIRADQCATSRFVQIAVAAGGDPTAWGAGAKVLLLHGVGFASWHAIRNLLAIAVATALIPAAGIGSEAAPAPQKANTVIVDQRALALLEQVQAHLLAIRNISAECIFTSRRLKGVSPTHTAAIRLTAKARLMRPSFYRVDVSLSSVKDNETTWHTVTDFETDASDGKNAWHGHPSDHEFDDDGSIAVGEARALNYIAPLRSFFDPAESVTRKIRLLAREDLLRKVTLVSTLPSGEYRTVQLVFQRPGSMVMETDAYFIGQDLLIHRIETSLSDGTKVTETTLSNIRLNVPMTASSYAFSPPADARHATALAPSTSSLLAKGVLAPGFTVKDEAGKSVRLSDLRGKWVIVDFWATWCGNCIQGFPGVNKLAVRYKRENVVALAICVGDTPKAFQSWMPSHRNLSEIRFVIDPLGMNGKGVAEMYHADALPTQYLIDPEGRIRASFLGLSGENERELAHVLEQAVTMQF